MVLLKVLIVEDIEERQKVLTSLYRAQAWVLVTTGQRTIKLVSAYDLLWNNDRKFIPLVSPCYQN